MRRLAWARIPSEQAKPSHQGVAIVQLTALRTGAPGRADVARPRAASRPSSLEEWPGACRPRIWRPATRIDPRRRWLLTTTWTSAPSSDRPAKRPSWRICARSCPSIPCKRLFKRGRGSCARGHPRARLWPASPLEMRDMDTPIGLPALPHRGSEAGSSGLAQRSAELTPLGQTARRATVGVGDSAPTERAVRPPVRGSGRVRAEAEPRASVSARRGDVR